MHLRTITAAFMAATFATASPIQRPRADVTSLLGGLGGLNAVEGVVSSLGVLKRSIKEGVETSAHQVRQDVLGMLGNLEAVQEAASSLGILKRSIKESVEASKHSAGQSLTSLLNDMLAGDSPDIDTSNISNLTATLSNATIPGYTPKSPTASAHRTRQDLSSMLTGLLMGSTPPKVDGMNIPDLSNLTTTLSTAPAPAVKPRQFQALDSVLAPLGVNVTQLGLMKTPLRKARADLAH